MIYINYLNIDYKKKSFIYVGKRVKINLYSFLKNK